MRLKSPPTPLFQRGEIRRYLFQKGRLKAPVGKKNFKSHPFEKGTVKAIPLKKELQKPPLKKGVGGIYQ
jgi:hypothetical protein